jgi:5-formaminoimidazole-4-carboxamide-1-(beta)-D-ribofuranosyl 5'-monophosphate synthetase
MDSPHLLDGYVPTKLTVGTLGGHSALDVCSGARAQGLRSLVVAKDGRERTYKRYGRRGEKGCIDELLVVEEFEDVLLEKVQARLRKVSTIFVHSRYFWVYFRDPLKVEREFHVPIFGSRYLPKLEERSQPYNQYHLLRDAGIRTPKIFASPEDIDRPVLVKASEAKRGYERAFFLATSTDDWEAIGRKMERDGSVSSDWKTAPIEEFIAGAPVNFNFFQSPLTGHLELLGTDTRRQTNLDGLLRLPAQRQIEALKHIDLKMIEMGHIAVTVKESLLERAYDLGEKFVAATKKLPKEIDPVGKGIIGPFALQGAVVAEEGREDIVIFDVSLRIPGSPGIAATPYSSYLFGRPVSMGERIAMEIRSAGEQGRLAEIVT